MLDLVDRGVRRAACPIRPQVAGRPLGLLLGLQTFHPLRDRPTTSALEPLPLDERVARLRDPELRARILAETPDGRRPRMAFIGIGLDRTFPLGDPPDYEPAPDGVDRRDRRARQGRDPSESSTTCCSSTTAASSCSARCSATRSFTQDPIREMLAAPGDRARASATAARTAARSATRRIETFMLTHWVRDRTRGERLPLELVVRKMTSDTASLYGLGDRGVLAPGKKADLNVIDFDGLTLRRPEMLHDLPAGAPRLCSAPTATTRRS